MGDADTGVFAASATVTVLFTDVVGSTRVLDQRGEEASAASMRRHYDVLRAALRGEGGDEVKSLGDGLMVVFRSALAAVRAGVAMQRSVDELADGDGLGLRVGIHMGEAAPDGDDWQGGAVVIAKRLCDLAGPNEILCSDVIRQVLGRGFGVPFAARGATALKGLAEPVAVHEVLWRGTGVAAEAEASAASPATEVLPLPPPLGAVDPLPFVGRSLELGRLAKTWQEVVADQRPRVLLLSGEAGIGKSTLAREFARRRHEEGTSVLFGRCDSDAVVPFQPVAEAIRHLRPEGVVAGLPSAVRSELARLVPGVFGADPAPRPAGGDPDLDRYLLFDAVAQLLGKVAERGPFLYVVDDAHWAGEASLLLLRYLLLLDSPIPMLVVATVRAGERDEHGFGALVAHLRRADAVERMSIGGLDEVDVDRIVEATGHEAISARSVYERSEGNPFFVRALLEAVAQGASPEDALPEGVLDVLQDRLSRLSDTARSVLEAGAVVGSMFEAALVAEVCGLDDLVVADAVDEVIDADLVEEVPDQPGVLVFGHQLVRQCLVGAGRSTRRALLHHRVAEAIERRAGTGLGAGPGRWAGDLAHHRLASGTRASVEQVLRACLAAATAAMDSFAYELAATTLEEALDAATAREAAPADRVPLLLTLSRALGATGKRDRARALAAEVVDEARRTGRADWQAEAALALAGTGSEIAVADPEVDAALVAASGLDGVPPGRRVELLARIAEQRIAAGEIASAHAYARDALETAATQADPATTVAATWAAYHSLAGPDERADRRTIAATLVDAGRVLHDEQTRYRVLRVRCLELAEQGDLAGVDGCLEELAGLALRVRQPRIGWLVGEIQAARALAGGDLVRAEDLAGQALGMGMEAQVTNAMAVYAMQLFAVRREQGRLAELASVAAPAASQRELPAVVVMRAALEASLGPPRPAAFDRLTPAFFEGVPRDAMWSGTLATGVELLPVVEDDLEVARVIKAQLVGAADRHIVVGYGALLLGPTRRILGEVCGHLGELDEAVEHLTAAVAEAEAGEAVLAGTYARISLARQLERRRGGGDLERTHEVAAVAYRQATDSGLVVLAERAQRSMRERG